MNNPITALVSAALWGCTCLYAMLVSIRIKWLHFRIVQRTKELNRLLGKYEVLKRRYKL